MSPSIVASVFWSASLLMLACGRQPPPGERTNQPSTTADSISDSALAIDTAEAQQPAVRPGAPSSEAADPRPIPVPGKKRQGVLGVSQLVDDASLAGTIIATRGTCLRRGAGQADGGPPVTRSDWELGEDGRAIWVSGPRPPECPAESGARVSIVTHGLVQVDTLRMLDGTRRPRVYLVLESSQ